jgi:hypothetical protein
LIRQWTEAAITLAIFVYEFFKGNVGDRLCRKARAHTVRINLRYESAELSQILLYVKAHDLKR